MAFKALMVDVEMLIYMIYMIKIRVLHMEIFAFLIKDHLPVAR